MFFKYIINYKNSENRSQSDYMTIKKEILNEFKEYKVIQGENIITQYRVITVDMKCETNRNVKCRNKEDQIIRG